MQIRTIEKSEGNLFRGVNAAATGMGWNLVGISPHIYMCNQSDFSLPLLGSKRAAILSSRIFRVVLPILISGMSHLSDNIFDGTKVLSLVETHREHCLGGTQRHCMGRGRCLAEETPSRIRTRHGRNQTARTRRLRISEPLPHQSTAKRRIREHVK